MIIKNVEDQVYKSRADKLSALVFSDTGADLTPDTATYIIYNSSNITIKSGSATISANEISVDLLSTDFILLEQGCRVEWIATSGTDSRLAASFFDVVLYKLHNSVITADILTYDSRFGNYPSGESDWSKTIQKAFGEVKRDLSRIGFRPALIVDSVQVQELVELKTVAKICLLFMLEVDTVWQALAKKYEAKYDDKLTTTPFEYDYNQDGVPDRRAVWGVKVTR